MIIDLFHVVFYDPLYNGLIFLLSVIPYADVGVAIIILTTLIKLVLFPLSLRAVKTQFMMRHIEPKANEIKEKFKQNRAEQAKKLMELYKTYGIKPFASIATLLIQIPIVIALYLIFARGGLPEINTDILYAFVHVPEMVHMSLFGLLDLSGGDAVGAIGSLPLSPTTAVLALLAGITTYLQMQLSLPPMKKRTDQPSLKDDLARSFQFQMRYVMPVLTTGVAYFFGAAVALYWITSNVFAIGQELYVRKNIRPGLEALSREHGSR